MTKKFTLGILITSFFIQSLYAAGMNTPVTKALLSQVAATQTISLPQPSRLISFKASLIHNKVLLQWVVSENETTDQFAIEKTADGKNFVMAAVIFGTDKPETGSYEFFDKGSKDNISYRLKIIDKNKQVEYSDILVIRSK